MHLAGYTCEQMLTHTTHALESKDAQLAGLAAKHQAAVTELQSTQVCTLQIITLYCNASFTLCRASVLHVHTRVWQLVLLYACRYVSP
jgi:hypothetical protein